MKKNTYWFSIIEILIWIFIFALWLTSVYMLILSTSKMNAYSKNSIIASNLSREGIEVVRNLRDNNYLGLYNWNKLPWSDVDKKISTWVYYKVENDLVNLDNLVKLEKIDDFWEWKNELDEQNGKMNQYRLYLTPNNEYTYNSWNWNTKTYFYRYITFEDVKYSSWWVNITQTWALKMISKVIWYNYWYHEVSLDTILTDWQRQ